MMETVSVVSTENPLENRQLSSDQGCSSAAASGFTMQLPRAERIIITDDGSVSDDESEEELHRPLTALHSLKSEWTLWFIRSDRSRQTWQDNMINVATIKTVEDYWR